MKPPARICQGLVQSPWHASQTSLAKRALGKGVKTLTDLLRVLRVGRIAAEREEPPIQLSLDQMYPGGLHEPFAFTAQVRWGVNAFQVGRGCRDV